MDKDKKNWMIAFVISIPLILAFFIFGPLLYESMDIAGKRAFMLVFQVVIIAIMGSIVLRWFQRYHEKETGE